MHRPSKYDSYDISDLHESLTPAMLTVQVAEARETWTSSIQDRELAAMRAFYTDAEAADLTVHEDWRMAPLRESKVLVTSANFDSILEFLSSGKVFVGFHPAIVEEDGELWLTY